LFLGLLIGLPSCKYFKAGKLFGKKTRTMDILKAQEDSIRVVDSLQNIKEHLAAIDNARLDSAKKANEGHVSVESNQKYNIIVGSFITPEYAKGFAQEFQKKGYDPKIILKKKSKFELVSVLGFDNFGKAASRLKQLRNTEQIEAWIYVNE
jgi:hypothetical protein